MRWILHIDAAVSRLLGPAPGASLHQWLSDGILQEATGRALAAQGWSGRGCLGSTMASIQKQSAPVREWPHQACTNRVVQIIAREPS